MNLASPSLPSLDFQALPTSRISPLHYFWAPGPVLAEAGSQAGLGYTG